MLAAKLARREICTMQSECRRSRRQCAKGSALSGSRGGESALSSKVAIGLGALTWGRWRHGGGSRRGGHRDRLPRVQAAVEVLVGRSEGNLPPRVQVHLAQQTVALHVQGAVFPAQPLQLVHLHGPRRNTRRKRVKRERESRQPSRTTAAEIYMYNTLFARLRSAESAALRRRELSPCAYIMVRNFGWEEIPHLHQ